MTAKRPQFRLFDFQVSEHREEIYDKYGNIDSTNRTFLVKMFGMNTKGKTYCIFAKNFKEKPKKSSEKTLENFFPKRSEFCKISSASSLQTVIVFSPFIKRIP